MYSCNECYKINNSVYKVEHLVGQTIWYDRNGDAITDTATIQQLNNSVNSGLAQKVDCEICCPVFAERETCVLLSTGISTRVYKRMEIDRETFDIIREKYISPPPQNSDITNLVVSEFICDDTEVAPPIPVPFDDEYVNRLVGQPFTAAVGENDQLCKDAVSTFVTIASTYQNIQSVSPNTSTTGTFQVTPASSGNFSFDYEIYCDGQPSGQTATVSGNAICEQSRTGTWVKINELVYRDNTTLTTVEFYTANSISDPSSVSKFGFTPNGTFNNRNFWSLPLANNQSLEFSYTWDQTREQPPTLDIDNISDDKANGRMVIKFNTPVTNPVIHIDRMGGFGRYTNVFQNPNTQTRSNSAKFTLTNANLSLTRLSGTNDFEVINKSFQKTPDLLMNNNASFESTLNGNDGTAAGSIRINGTNISQVEFLIEAVGVEGAGIDGIEIIISGAIC